MEDIDLQLTEFYVCMFHLHYLELDHHSTDPLKTDRHCVFHLSAGLACHKEHVFLFFLWTHSPYAP